MSVWYRLLVMIWGQAVTIIFGTASFMGISMFLVNKRIDIRELKREVREIRELLYKVLGSEKLRRDERVVHEDLYAKS